MQLIVVVGIAAAIALGLSMMMIQRRRQRFATVFYFDRQGQVHQSRGESFAGLVTFEDGGFMEREQARLNMRYGSPTFEKGPVAWRRKRKPVFLVRAGDSSALEMAVDGSITVNNVSDAEYGSRMELSSDLAVAEVAKKRAGADLLNMSLGATLVLLAVGDAAIGISIAVKG